ncbi:unnamed protein product [Caenorhabditis brenneri]
MQSPPSSMNRCLNDGSFPNHDNSVMPGNQVLQHPQEYAGTNVSRRHSKQKRCSIRNAIVIRPMKYIKEEVRTIVLQNPGPIYKTPCIKPTGGKIFRLPDSEQEEQPFGCGGRKA